MWIWGWFFKKSKNAFFGHPVIFRILIFFWFLDSSGIYMVRRVSKFFFYISKSPGSEVQEMSSSMLLVKSSSTSLHQNDHWYCPLGGRWVFLQNQIPQAASEAEIFNNFEKWQKSDFLEHPIWYSKIFFFSKIQFYHLK